MSSLRWLKLNRTGLCYLPEELASLQKLVIVYCTAESQFHILQLGLVNLLIFILWSFFFFFFCPFCVKSGTFVRESQQPHNTAWRIVKSSQPEGKYDRPYCEILDMFSTSVSHKYQYI